MGLGGQPTEGGHRRKQGRGWQPSGGGKGHSHTQQVRSTFRTHFPEYSYPQRVPPALIPILQRNKLRLLPKPHCRQETGEASILHKWRCSTHPRDGETVLLLPGTRPSLPCGCLSPTSLQASRQALLDPAHPPRQSSPVTYLLKFKHMQDEVQPHLCSQLAQPHARQPISLPPDLHYSFSRPFFCCPRPPGCQPPSPSEHLIQRRNPICVKGSG